MSLCLEGVTRIVDGEVHIDDVELELQTGRLYVLLGPTTAGKTSLMRIMAGLDRPTSGRVIADGKDVTGAAVRKRDVAMVYQQFINYPSFTVYDNIASPLKARGLATQELDQRVRRMAALLHIDELLDRQPAELSGGQQQRCAIARALVKESALLLLDEPLANLDYKLREELRAELQELFERREAVVVYSTTEPLEALVMGGDVIIMDEGRVLQVGPASKVYHRPGSYRVARIFSDPPMNMIEVVPNGGVATSAGGLELPLEGHLSGVDGRRIQLGIRASDLTLHPGHAGLIPVQGTVELAEISGSETFTHITHNRISWVVQEDGVHEHPIGKEITIYLDPERIYAFGETGALEAAPAAPGD